MLKAGISSRLFKCSFATYSPKESLHMRQVVKAKISHVDATAPFLIDSFERKHDYLRISLTERCNLRCFYCMPNEGVELSPEGKLLTDQEIIRLASLFVDNGIAKIRLTGGEPSIRKGILELVRSLQKLKQRGLESIAMTSNGIALYRRLPQLIENGLTHLNLSLDTLDPLKFELITRRRGHDAVLKCLDVALTSSLASVKLNAVIVKGLNDSEILDFVDMTKHKPISVRFIEFMPFTGNRWNKEKMIPSSELLRRITTRYPDVVRVPDKQNDTTKSWKVPGFQGSFGFISSMSDHFCGTCNRLRLTADGQFKVCLFDPNEVSLRDAMREGASDKELIDKISVAVSGKKAKHAGMSDIDVTTNRPMILIGASTHRGFRRPSQLRRRLYSTEPRLTHLDQHGKAAMVDVAHKACTLRSATATGHIYITRVAYDLVFQQNSLKITDGSREAKARKKGDVLAVAQVSAIMAAKKTSSLIPLCHPLALSHIDVKFTPELPPPGVRSNDRPKIICTAQVKCEGRTGVEMEALTAVSVGLLTIWDMLKAAAGKEMEIGGMMVISKSGGKSGDFQRDQLVTA